MDAPDVSGESVRELLSALLGREVTVRPAGRPGTPGLEARYRDADGTPRFACVCDQAFGAFAAGALTMRPPGPVREAAAGGELTGTLREDLYEVLNVLASLLNHGGEVHVALAEVDSEGLPDPADLEDPGLQVGIAGYGDGWLAFRAVSAAEVDEPGDASDEEEAPADPRVQVAMPDGTLVP